MDKFTFSLNNQTYSNNNNILLRIITELQQIINTTHENLTIKRISDIIIKMNYIINENKKNHESIMNQFTILQNKFDQLSQKLNINNINNNQELKGIKNGYNWRYVGQAVNGLREGKGICYWDDGDRYEGDYKNDNKEGKGIYYFNDGDRYEGDFKNDKREGKGIYYYNKEPFKGDRYEGDFRNDISEGNGVYYYHNGEREMGDYYKGNKIGKHVMLTRNGEVKINNY